MHLPSHKLQLRPKLATVLHHSSNTSTSTSKAPEVTKPTKTHSSLNIKDKRNIKISIVALRTVSKRTDKAALTLEKLEGQDTSKHCQERQARLMAEYAGKSYSKEAQKTRVWKEIVEYPVTTQVSSSRGIEVSEEPKMSGVPALLGKKESHSTASAVAVPSVEAHPVHALSPTVEYYNGISDDEDERKLRKEAGLETDTDDEDEADENSSDVSSDDEKEEDSDDDTDSEEDDGLDDAEDSEEQEVAARIPIIPHTKK